MARPKISNATINELFGPGLQPGADCGMDAEEIAGVIRLLEKDDSDVALGSAMDELLHKIMPKESNSPSFARVRRWHYAIGRRNKKLVPQTFIGIKTK